MGLRSAEHGQVDAQHEAGNLYSRGIDGMPKDLSKDFFWFRKGAENGNPRSQLDVGAMYGAGLGVEKNSEEAVKWFRHSTEQGNSTAQFNLGSMYARGEGSRRMR